MRSAALLLGLLQLCVSPLVGRAAEVPAPPDPADLPGIYECQGTGADGRPYRGAVIIEPDGTTLQPAPRQRPSGTRPFGSSRPI
jgi:hypothetical protein